MGHQAFAFLIIFIGGGLGSMLRHTFNQAAVAIFGPDFPFGTVFVNITGSLAIGLIAGWYALRGGGDQMLRLFLTTGLLGGFTTFSAFSLDAALLWQRGQSTAIAVYVLGSVVTAILAVFVGLAIMRSLLT
jgi:CrcB protein